MAPVKDVNGIWCRSNKDKATAFKNYLEETYTPYDICEMNEAIKIKDFDDMYQ